MQKVALRFPPPEVVSPRPHPETWVLFLDSLCPTLEPAMAVIREKGKPPRVIRMEPDFEVVELR